MQDFKKFISQLNKPQAKFAVAVSGGIDSVVLCELCQQAGIEFSLAHCNFKLRGEESERDEQFVRSLAKKYAVAILVKEFETDKYASEKKYSIQVAARELRYDWFASLHEADKNSYVLLAHHANDNIETVLMNFFRGTGIEGMTGMPSMVKESFCLRPLLNNTRREMEEFAALHQLTWVEDSSNQSSKYTRNFFRNELLPALKKVYPAVEENLLDNISRFKQIDALYKIGIEKIKKEILENRGEDAIIPIHKLKPYRETSLIYELIKQYGFGEKQVAEIIKLMESEAGRYLENEHYQVIRHRKNLVITPKYSPVQTAIVVDKDKKKISLTGLELQLKFYAASDLKIKKEKNSAQLDAGLVTFPLLVRRWQEGDYFYPLGLRKKKKLARFFIDQKLSKPDKEKIWVVESGKRIVWIAGLRIDDRFKITISTKEVLELSISIP